MGNALARVLPVLLAVGLTYAVHLFFASNPQHGAILGVYVVGVVLGFFVGKSMS